MKSFAGGSRSSGLDVMTYSIYLVVTGKHGGG
jgi:hypothetical protein